MPSALGLLHDSFYDLAVFADNTNTSNTNFTSY